MKILNEIKTGDRLWIKSDQHPDWVAIQVITNVNQDGLIKVKYLTQKTNEIEALEKMIGSGVDYDIYPKFKNDELNKFGFSINLTKMKENQDLSSFNRLLKFLKDKGIFISDEILDELFIEITQSSFLPIAD